VVAQPTGIGLTLLNYTVENNQDNIDLGRTVTINALITNYDSSEFVGTLDFGLRNTQQQLSSTDLFNKPPFSGNTIILNPGESVPAVFSVDVDAPYFIPGPDVVVVWPISTAPIGDSIVINLNINGATGITSANQLKLSYLVLSDKIVWTNTATENPIEQVRIYNLIGQTIYSTNGDNNEVPTNQLNSGLYICEIRSADKRSIIKFMK
jgi:hypothetical protein